MYTGQEVMKSGRKDESAGFGQLDYEAEGRAPTWAFSEQLLAVRCGVAANIIAFHAIARGSIPRIGGYFCHSAT